MTTMQLLIDGRNTLGECVLWCDRTQRIWWTDIEGSTLYCHTPGQGATRQYPMPERLASFALTGDDDRLLLGLASRLAFYDIADGRITPICDIEPALATTRVNDGRCDREGNFVFGTINEAKGHAPIGGFYRLNHDLSLERLPLQSVGIANSICFSRDGRTMYHSDSPTRQIRCCDYAGKTGSIGNERVFVDLGTSPGVPDGSTVDADDFVWNAQWGGARVVRYAPDGRAERTIEVPASQPSCVAFGGAGFDRLFVTSARCDLQDSELAHEPGAGGVFHVDTGDIRGLPEVRFHGRLLRGNPALISERNEGLTPC